MLGDTIDLGRSQGINNRLPEDRLSPEQARAATNVELGATGQIRMPRPGKLTLLAGDTHSLHYSPCYKRLILRQADKLLLISREALDDHLRELRLGNPSTLVTTTLEAGIPSGLRLSYAELGRWLYAVGVDRALSIDLAQGTRQAFGPSPMRGSAMLTAVSSGQLADYAVYHVMLAPVDAYGREGGAWAFERITLPLGHHAISIAAPPAPAADIAQFNIYITDPGGDEYYFLNPVAPTGSYLHRTPHELGRPLATRFLDVPMHGTLLVQAWSRLLLADGVYLWMSRAYHPHLFDFLNEGLVFPEPISAIAVLDSSVWVCSDKHSWFLSGRDPLRWNLSRVSQGGAIPNTVQVGDAYKLGERDVAGLIAQWRSQDGIMRATNDGTLRNVTQDTYAPEYGGEGASVVRYANGTAQYISTLRGGQAGKLRVGEHVFVRKE